MTVPKLNHALSLIAGSMKVEHYNVVSTSAASSSFSGTSGSLIADPWTRLPWMPPMIYADGGGAVGLVHAIQPDGDYGPEGTMMVRLDTFDFDVTITLTFFSGSFEGTIPGGQSNVQVGWWTKGDRSDQFGTSFDIGPGEGGGSQQGGSWEFIDVRPNSGAAVVTGPFTPMVGNTPQTLRLKVESGGAGNLNIWVNSQQIVTDYSMIPGGHTNNPPYDLVLPVAGHNIFYIGMFNGMINDVSFA